MSLSSYMREIGTEKNLSSEREKELVLLAQAGDTEALQELTRANLRFVVSMAKKFQGQGIDLEDLISEGNIGLMKAAYRFDPGKNVKFLSYAVWWIRQAIMEALALDGRTVRLPVNRLVDREAIRKAERVLEQRLGYEPSEEELAKYLEMDVEDVTCAYLASEHITLIHEEVNGGNEASEKLAWMDILENPNAEDPEEIVKENDTASVAAGLLNTLSNREADVVRMAFGIGYDCEYGDDDIGHMLGVSKQRIHQIKKKAMTALQEAACAA